MKRFNRDQIRLIASTVNTIGIAWIVGGAIAPILRPEGNFSIILTGLWCVYGIACIFLALKILSFLPEERQ